VAAVFVIHLSADEPAAGTASQDAGPTPDQALERLKEGNARFVADMSREAELGSKKRIELAQGQRPVAVVLTCADSRAAPEIIFDKGLGMLFVIRVAGNVGGPEVLPCVARTNSGRGYRSVARSRDGESIREKAFGTYRVVFAGTESRKGHRKGDSEFCAIRPPSPLKRPEVGSRASNWAP
jgi:hypothetical protein